ncbi:hypothetical protein [Actinoplanes sp. TFC3]|uniref:hypothetical protein n=1 Tax=Actinoplanes sp. TFC3 TaxID=1710355 RepID=UPI00083660A3|nr:hypothetical protein [Actinoplanes sp. TFC3]
MIGEQDVREQMQSVQVPASSLRVEALVAGGRKRVLRRRMVRAGCGVALAAGLLAGVPSLVLDGGGSSLADQAAAAPSASGGPQQGATNPASPLVRCPGTSLPIPDGMGAVQPAGVDPSGRYVLGNNASNSMKSTPEGKVSGVAASQVILWTDGQPQVLPMVRDWVLSSAVNADGVVAAVAGPKDKGADTVVRYTNGMPEMFPSPAGKWEFRLASINAAGDVLVNAYRPGGGLGADAVLLWKAGSAAQKLPLPAKAEGMSLLDDGSIVGRIISNKGGKVTSYVWDQQGTGQALQTPAGQDGSVFSARGDWAAGNVSPSGVARWNLKTGDLRELKIGAPANGINASGWIAANGTVLRDDANVELGLADGKRGDPMYVADNGLVVGLPFDGSSGAITWRC